MCGNVAIVDPNSEHGYTTIHSLGELRQHFTVLPEDHDEGDPDDLCFCCVDVAAVLQRTGDEWWEGLCDDWRPRALVSDPTGGWWIRKVNVQE